MYKTMLPYNRQQDQSGIQGHHDTFGNVYVNHLRRSPHYPLARAIHSGVQRMRSVLRRSPTMHSARALTRWRG